MLRIPDLIHKKRDKGELSHEEICYFVNQVVNNGIEDAQIGAMLMAMYLNGLSKEEIISLTGSMATTGDTMEWPAEWKDILVDKHSTGGVGDKVSLILAPALAALGLKVPMVSGRGLGFTGGTLDKLESIPGYRVSLSTEEMKSCLETAGCFIAGQTSGLVPADRRLYALRDVTATVDSLGLITASIISKKTAESIRALVLDVKVGKAAFMKTLEDAVLLSNSLVAAANGQGITTTAVITQMDSPIGIAIGNALEVAECMEVLRGGLCAPDLYELVTTLGGILLLSINHVETLDEGITLVSQTLVDGSAIAAFEKMICCQGVEETTAKEICRGETWNALPKAQSVKHTVARTRGFIVEMDALAVAKACGALGASRMRASDQLDLSVGFRLLKQVGEEVEEGQPWGEVHYSNCLPDEIFQQISNAITISEEKPLIAKRLLEIIR